MTLLTSELENLARLYDSLQFRLDKQFQDFRASRFPEAGEEAEYASLQRQILDAEIRLTRIVYEVGNSPLRTGADRDAIIAQTATLRQHAHHLLEIIERNAAQCRQLQSAAQSGLQELQQGGKFLQSVRGYRENQPKFLDSCQ
jgi:hypothetical protein